MKKFTFLILSLALFISGAITAQDVLVVAPGVGTLNDAIEANGGDKIYQLEAGGWYQLNKPIENIDYHLQIIGEEPADGGLPATLQSNQDAGGVVFHSMFDAKGPITLKNIYVMNVDLVGTKGTFLIIHSDSASLTVVDNCVLDPVTISGGIRNTMGASKVFFTNNQVLNQGHELSPNDGHFFDEAGPQGLDTLIVENNTFVCMGTNMFSGQFAAVVHGYIKFNHNTWVMQKSQIDWSCFEESFIFTNNLMFDFNTQVWAANWQPMPGGDAAAPKPALIYADTIPGETLPSTRQQFWEYNMHYRNPGFYTVLDELNEFADANGLVNVNYMSFLWPEDSINAVIPTNIPRETILFADDVNFPNWKEGNNLKDIDPMFEDQAIYTHSDNFVKWTKPASLVHALGQPAEDYPLPWASWHWDPDGDITINDTWPVFNGKYTNEDLLRASIENLPLGDLNWFPESKVKWEADKDAIDAHIHAGNEGKFVLTAITSVDDVTSIKMYPNPAQDVLNFTTSGDNEITIRSIDGRTLRFVKNVSRVSISDFNNGIYLVTVKEGNTTSTRKLVIER